MKHTREGKEVTYIHYGSHAFDTERFTPAIQEGCWVKPLYNYLYGWDCDSIVVFNREAIVLC